MHETSKLIKKHLGDLKKIYKNFDKDFLLIKKACDVAEIAHKGQYRFLTGEAFLEHPMKVAIMVAEKTEDLSLILAAILHDTVEDSFDLCPMFCIYQEFGEDVGFLVDSVSSNLNHYHQFPKVIFNNKIDKFLFGVMKDVRCAFLKLMDRDHNNKTLAGLKTDKQIRKTFETQALYNPLKKILKLDNKNFVYDDIFDNFKKYIQKNKIKNIEDLKTNLYNITFDDINSCNFHLFYYGSKNVVWEIDDKKMFKKLLKSNFFDNSIEIISLTQDVKDNFACLFKYKGGKICNQKIKMKISSFNC